MKPFGEVQEEHAMLNTISRWLRYVGLLTAAWLMMVPLAVSEDASPPRQEAQEQPS